MTEAVLDRPAEVAAARSSRVRTSFDVQVDESRDRTGFRLQGELDMASAPVLEQVLHSALDSRPARLALDLTQLSFIDSSGVRVLLTACRRARAQGCTFLLRSPGPSVRRMLRLAGVEQLMMPDSGSPRPGEAKA